MSVAAITCQNKAVVYDILFQATAETLRTITADPKRLGAEIGFAEVATERVAALELPQHWHNLPIVVWRACARTFGAANMPTRNVVLSDHQQELVETRVKSGRYQNASEVLRAGLRLIEERERIGEAKLKALKQAARQGWTDVSAGRYADVADDQLEDFVGQLGRRAAQMAKTAG